MKKQIIKEFKDTISYLKTNANGVVIIDVNNRVYVFDNSLKIKNAFKINLPSNKPNENSIAVDDNFECLLLAVSRKPLTLWDIKNKKLINTFDWHKGDVLSVVFGDNYFASGGLDGKIFLYSLDLFKMVSKVARHKDFISGLAFGTDEIYATGYDKSVLFVNLDSFEKKVRYLHLKKALKIINSNYLVSASEISDIIKWEVLKKETKDRINLYEKFKDFTIYGDYLFVATENRIVLYDLKSEILVNEKFFEFSADKICVYDDRVYFSKGNVFGYAELFDEIELLDTVLRGDYKNAYEMVVSNPFLKKTRTYQKLETLYKSSLKKAVKYLENGLKSKAIEVLKPFMDVMEKREEVAKTLSHFENFIKFKKAYEHRNFALLYQLAENYGLLKQTKYYIMAEKEWEIKFEKAKKLALQGRVSEARELLKEFIPVSVKLPLIELLLKKAELFRLLREKIAKKDFGGFFAIIKEHPELKNTKEYEAVMEYARKLYEHALKALREENFKYVLKAATVLEEIEGYELKARELLTQAQVSLEFLRLFAKDKNKAFELVEKHPFLKELKVYKLYEEKWLLKLKKAERSAFRGKIKQALEELREYEHIKSKKARIKNMIKSAYLNYIKDSHDKKAIEKYIDKFGNDEEINRLIARI